MKTQRTLAELKRLGNAARVDAQAAIDSAHEIVFPSKQLRRELANVHGDRVENKFPVKDRAVLTANWVGDRAVCWRRPFASGSE